MTDEIDRQNTVDMNCDDMRPLLLRIAAKVVIRAAFTVSDLVS
jgi:hypothetical protein